VNRTYSIAEARNQLPSLVHDAERGVRVELTRRGKPVAVLLSVREYQRLSGGGKGLWSALKEFRARHDLTALDAESVFEGVRDRSPGRTGKW
jgi:prevent-host-death family protein